MNTFNLIGENESTSNVTLALSLVRAICNKKDVFTVQIDSPGEKPQLLSFKLDYQARFKTNLNRLLREISESASSKEAYSIRVPEPENSNSSERQVVRLMNSVSLDEFISAESEFLSQFQPCRFSDSGPSM
jgi:hypothetical protein